MMYRVLNNHEGCHPETCTCLDWQLVDDNNKIVTRSDDKAGLQSLADRKNAQKAAKQA